MLNSAAVGWYHLLADLSNTWYTSLRRPIHQTYIYDLLRISFSIYLLFINLLVWPSASQFFCLSMSVCLSICLSVCLFFYLSICCLYLSIYLSVCLCLSVCLSTFHSMLINQWYSSLLPYCLLACLFQHSTAASRLPGGCDRGAIWRTPSQGNNRHRRFTYGGWVIRNYSTFCLAS